MSKKQQINKNIELSEKLANYFASNPSASESLPKNVSVVAFSATDKVLNSLNANLVKSLIQQGKKVIKAMETNNKSNPWEFTQVSI